MEKAIKMNETEVKSEISTDESIGIGENNAFVRLASTPTINYLLRKKETFPNHSHTVDSLDLALTSVYNHHTQWWASRSAVVLQSPFRCRPIKMLQTDMAKADSENLAIYKERYRNHPNHVGISLTSNHLSTTHRGFGRSIDGVFFTS